MRTPLLSIVLILIAVPAVHAQGWRGIVPLHTSRTIVEQLIGKAKVDGTVPTYEFDNETVKIFYSEYPCGNQLNVEQWNLPPDIVLSILITPKRAMQFAELNVDLSKFSRKRVSWDAPEGYFDFLVDYNNGLMLYLNLAGNLIQSYRYVARKSDAYLHCPGYSEDEKSKVCFNFAFIIDCSSEEIRPGIPVECWYQGDSVKNVPMKLNWTVSAGATVLTQDDKAVKFMLTDLTQSRIEVTVKVVSPSVCGLDTASTRIPVVKAKVNSQKPR